MGRARALASALTGDAIAAKEAERIGMIYKCVPNPDLMKETMALAEKLDRGPTLAFYQTRLAFDKGLDNTFQQQVDLEREIQGLLGDAPDFLTGVKKFNGQKDLNFPVKKPVANL